MLATAIGAAVLAILPPAAVQLPAPAPPQPPTAAGAFHVHTDRSDGSGSMDDIARAARDAGLKFVIFTDHGDGTRRPEPPAYRDGVLTIDGVEISTAGGHYAVIGMRQAPYPLAGEPRDVLEDVARLGGFGFVAHGDSPRPELRWSDWDLAADGIEWANLDTAWRRAPASRLARALAAYWFRAPEAVGSVLDSARGTLQRLDAAARTRRVVSIATADAHGPLLPSYESCFRAMSTHVMLDAPLSGDAAADAQSLLAAIAAGRHYSVIDAFATPAAFEFSAEPESGGAVPARQGEAVPAGGHVLFSAQAMGPPDAEIVLLRDGEVVRRARARTMIYQVDGRPAAYRVEVRVADRPVPWIVSNPIWVGPPPRPAPAGEAKLPSADAAAAVSAHGWRAEADPSSRATVEGPGGEHPLLFRYALGQGEPRNQFAAMAAAVPADLGRFAGISLDAVASSPMRIALELVREGPNPVRWRRSVYLDAERREVFAPIGGFRPVGGPSEPLDVESVDTLRLIVDTNNTAPGSGGEISFYRVAYRR